MSGEQEQQDHWRELAELLGVEPEPAPAKSGPEPAKSGPEPAKSGPEPKPPVREERAEVSRPSQPQRSVQPAPRAEPEATPHDEERVDQREPDMTSPRAEEEGDFRRGRDEDGPRRGRRRGGRRGGPKDDSRRKPFPADRRRDDQHRPEPEEVPERVEEEPAEQRSWPARDEIRARTDIDDDEPPAPEETTEEDVEEIEEQAAPAEPVDQEDEEEAPADWNVMTWSQLIASLQRSDR